MFLSQFSENFTILLFHYDGITTEWDDLEWSKRAIHVSVRKQTKWQERFLAPICNSKCMYVVDILCL